PRLDQIARIGRGMVGAASPDRHHRRGWLRAQAVAKGCKRTRVALQLLLNAIRRLGSLSIHIGFHRTADSAEEQYMNQKNRRIILYIMAIWFLISFVTNIIGPLIPIIIKWY